MSDAPSTPSFAPTTARPRERSIGRRPSSGALATPARHAPAPALPTNSPHYTTSLRSRHSLYGTEDRVVLDVGSRVWKVGFSGEGGPRECRSVLTMLGKEEGGVGLGAVGLWGLEKSDVGEIEWEIREERLKRGLRDVWFNHLMTDPKSRKVIVVENPLLSTRVKEMIARVLFGNLQVPSLSFASSPLLALIATGTVTGLVVDCGNLETTILPIFSSRPLFPNLLSTPRAGARINARLRALLLQFGSYVMPPSSLNSVAPPVVTRVPLELLSEELVEEIKNRACFVSEAPGLDGYGTEAMFAEEGEAMDTENEEEAQAREELAMLKRMERRYAASSQATTISFRIPSLSSPPVITGVGRGWLQIPGWVRERAAEVLFEEGDEDERSITETILESLLKLPIDLRRPLASSILVVGGTSMLPGFFPRLRTSLHAALSVSHPPSPPPSPPLDVGLTPRTTRQATLTNRLMTLRATPRFAPLVHLSQSIMIRNDPSSSSSTAPAFAPSLLPWVGGSLAGALKTGGEEIKREQWEEALEAGWGEGGEELGEGEEAAGKERFALPDWTRLRAV